VLPGKLRLVRIGLTAPARQVIVASANKTARTAWALLVRGETYKAAPAA